MPRIKSYAPSWLTAPAPGHKLFAPGEDDKPPASLGYGRKSKPGRRQAIARRGTEVFVACGKQIRWGDLIYLRESWEPRQSGGRAGGGPSRTNNSDGSDGSFEIYDEEASDDSGGAGGMAEGFRIIKTPAADDIRQLIMSPQQDLLAVLTTHTVHICILPDSSHLSTKDSSPFKAKFWTLGPTVHVTSRPAVVSALWHPLGVNGSCLVTVTEDAVVRVWELSTADRWSFDAPTLAVDLKKLADGHSLDQDFSASTSTTNKGFSPDSFDMEVASACFPGRGSGGWSAMTLWVAMTGGDVYALCPLLPRRWAPPPTLISSLSVSIVAKVAAIEDDPKVPPQTKLLAQQQLEWMSDLDSQDPKLVEGTLGEPLVEVYQRPSRPGTVPKLQGPFQFDFNPDDEPDEDVELKDIFVIGEKINTADLMMGEEDVLDVDDYEQDGLSLSVICLLSTSGQVKICLDIDGVEAQWLPPRNKPKTRRPALEAEQPTLVTFQTLDTMKPAEIRADCWPVFSDDVMSRYSFYVTHAAGITHISLASWVFRLESEISGASEAGAEFRMDILVKGQGSERERIYTQRAEQGALAAAVAFRDPDLGYFVLSTANHEPVAVFFETPEEDRAPLDAVASAVSADRHEEPQYPLEIWEPRPLFHASEALTKETDVGRWLSHLKAGKRRPLLNQEVRLSPATLEIFTEGHRLVSAEVFDLNQAVAELFRKCESLQGELRDQITKGNEARHRIDSITGDDVEEGELVSDNMRVKRRLQVAQARQAELAKRMENLRRKLGRSTTRELSDKEKAWMDEVRSLEDSIAGVAIGEASTTSPVKGGAKQALHRFEEIQSLKQALFSQIQHLLQPREPGDGMAQDRSASPAPNLKIPSELRKAKIGQVMALLDRETALVDAVKSRLERLTTVG